MTSPISLGLTPLEMSVVLTHGGDFVASLVAVDPWPAGTQVELRFSTGPTATPMVWPATVNGTTVSWDVPAVTVKLVIDAAATTARLHYIEPDGTVLVWGRGRVRTI